LRAILGDRSLITLDGQEHRERRRLLAPAFSPRAIQDYDAITIEKTRAVIGELGLGRPFSFYEAARRISLTAIVRFLFGEQDTGSMEGLVEEFLQSFRNPLVLYLKFLQVDLGVASPWGRALRNRDRLRARILGEIARHREGRGSRSGLLAALFASGGNPGDDDLTTEVLTLLMFGHDTGAAAMAWAMVHLLQHPEARQQAGRSAYLEAAIRESMRLCPVVVNVTRVARRDLEFAGFRVRAGERVLPCTYVAHHNEDVFPDAGRFLPERFLQGRNYGHAYFPFGIGGRLCLGEPFAMRQMMLILSTFLAEASLEFAPGYQPRPKRNLVLIMPSGGTVVVNRRGARVREPSAGLLQRVRQ
jgi:cytochrome P450